MNDVPETRINGGQEAERVGTQAVLQGSMTIQQACEIRDTLLSHLASPGDLLLDLDGVQEIDVTGLQLLCAAHRSTVKRGRELHLVKPLPPVIAQAVSASGLHACACGLQEHASCLWAMGDAHE